MKHPADHRPATERLRRLRELALGIGADPDQEIRLERLDHPGEMFAALKGAPLLGPFRGEPAVQLETAIDGLLRLQQLVRDFPTIQEVEINPFILAGRGKRSAAVDARLRLEE